MERLNFKEICLQIVRLYSLKFRANGMFEMACGDDFLTIDADFTNWYARRSKMTGCVKRIHP